MKRSVKGWHAGLVLALTVALSAGCSGDQPIQAPENQVTAMPPDQTAPTPTEPTAPTTVHQSTPAPEAQEAPAQVDGDGSETDTGTVLDTAYPNALGVGSQLALGIMLLEGTEYAATPQQAKTLLPLWQEIQGKILQGDTEVSAILAQIEEGMTQEQLDAIAAMRLTPDNLQAWAQSQRANLGGRGSREPPPGTPPPGGRSGRGSAEGKYLAILLRPLVELLA